MRYRCMLFSLILMLASFASTALAAPRVDPELTARMPIAPGTRQLGVILTFHGSQITDAQIAAVKSLGITTGVRMTNFPIVAVNATRGQIQQMI